MHKYILSLTYSTITKKNITVLTHHKAILRLGVPIAIGQLGVIIMGFADTMMVGRYSTDSLAAASFVNSVFNLITFLLMGYSYGLTPLVSSLFGQGRKLEAGGILKQAVAANMLFALLLCTIMGVGYFFLDHMGQPAEIMPLVRSYYLVVLVSMIFVALFNCLRQFTDGITETKTAMWALLTGNALNIVGNYLLIYGVGPFPELGLLGAGLSTLFSRIVMALILLGVLLMRQRYAVYRQGVSETPLRWSGLWHINSQSLPISLQMGMESGAFTFTAIMAGWIGAVDLATFQVMVTIGTLGFLFYYSFGAGLSIRVATFYGLHDWEHVRLSTRAGCHILLGMAACSSLIFLLFGEFLIRVFTSDPEVMVLAVSLIPPLILYQLGDAMQICYANALRGTSHVMSMMWIAFISYILVNIPAGYILAFPLGMGIYGLFIAFSLGLFVAAALFLSHYRSVMRKSESQVA